jgi:antitoxin component YwqK of YwqJK toxin-antitoxin module
MRKNKDKIQYNDKGQRHGLWEVYYDGNLWHKCFYHNGKEVGCEEWYYGNGNGKLREKTYYL